MLELIVVMKMNVTSILFNAKKYIWFSKNRTEFSTACFYNWKIFCAKQIYKIGTLYVTWNLFDDQQLKWNLIQGNK